jgi:ribosomal protein L34E
LAKKINPQKSWTEIVADLKKKYPSKESLLEFYKKEMAKARDFVKKRDLVTIPKGENLTIVETPIFQRNVIPYGGYMSPAPFEKRQE